jgi:small ligand-binding sensory domain FIST
VTLIGDGLAVGPDLVAAARSATAQALDALGSQPDLVCVFVCGDDPEEVRRAGEAAMARAGGAVTLGCSTGGVIGDGRGVELPNAVSVWAASLPGARITPFELRTGRAADRLIVTGMADPNPDDQVALLLADPYTFPVDAFIERSADVFDGLAFVGGLAGGESEDVQMFAGGLSTDAGAVGVLLGGSLSVTTLVSQGCRPIGPAMTVTGCEGNVITELAGTPALAKLEQIVGDLPDEDRPAIADGLQIGIVMDEYADEHDRGDFLVRGVVDIDADTGSLTVGDVIDIGQTVRFQVRDPDTADQDLGHLLAAFLDDEGFGPVEGALLFSCTGRGADMFVTADHDVRAVRRRLGTRRVAGFFASGEIGPVGGRNHVHSYTASILAFGTPVEVPDWE